VTKLILNSPTFGDDADAISNTEMTSPSNIPISNMMNSTEPPCMTWADTFYIVISCDTSPLSKYGAKVEPIDSIRLKNMRKVEVSPAYDFFTEDGKPLVWYHKTKEGKSNILPHRDYIP